MLSKEEKLREWDRVVAMCKGTKFEGKEYECVKVRTCVGIYLTATVIPIFSEKPDNKIFAIAIVDDVPIWLEEPFTLYAKGYSWGDYEFTYDSISKYIVGRTKSNLVDPIKIPLDSIQWENFTLIKPESTVEISIVDSKQVGGSHYKDKALQPWAYMEANFTKEEFVGFLKGNAFKYMMRFQDKNGIEDLKKAIHYIEKLIQVESKS